MPEFTATAGRYARTLRHLRPWQVLGRAVAPLRRHAAILRAPDPPGALDASDLDLTPGHDPCNTADALLAGRFSFLRHEEGLGFPPDWQASDAPLLWRFNLHYFNYLSLLPSDRKLALCRAWIADNPPSRGVGWHPYPTSLRIVNWCRASVDAPDVLESLYRQAAYLYRNLETHVYGNHLLENARALIVAGARLAGSGESSRWLSRGLTVVRTETPEQILPDGGHFERSPMYHALMLELYLDILSCLPPSHPDRHWISQTAQSMGGVLRAFTHPNGSLALFNDSTQEIATPSERLLERLVALTGARPEPQNSMPSTGYFVEHDDQIYLIIDAGPAGPDFLMAHAHADLFSFELSVGGHPLVTDSGVFEYGAGPMRDYVRSTAAHNTVSIDGRDQIECWGSFRVGRRAAPEVVRFGSGPRGMTFEGTFRGYARLLDGSPTHVRRFQLDRVARVLSVEDEVTGHGRHSVESRIHFHPGVDVDVRSGILTTGTYQCRLNVEAGEILWGEGWYCPEFGLRMKRPVATIRTDGYLPTRIGYSLSYSTTH